MPLVQYEFGDQAVQAEPLALRQARVRDVFESRMAHPPHEIAAHDDLGLLELSQLVGGRGIVDHRKLLSVEGVHEDGWPPRQLAAPRRPGVGSGAGGWLA